MVASVLASGLTTAASSSPAAAVHPSYTTIDLVDPSGGQTSFGRYINNAGQVSVYTGGSASSWTAAGGLVDIGNLGVPAVVSRDMNESGQIVGESSFDATNNTHAFLWTPGGTMEDLGTLPGFTSSIAMAMNDNGTVVGMLRGPSGENPHAFVWTAADGMIDIGPASGRSYAVDVNNSDVVVVMDITTFPAHAAIWTEEGGLVYLPNPHGGDTIATDINDSGMVVGLTNASVPGQRHAFVWTQTNGMVDIDTLGWDFSAPSAINNSGQVAGYGETGSDALAFFWSPSTGMVDLGTLADGETEANAINELGQVVGYSFVGGDFHGFVWTAEDGMMDLGVEEVYDINDSGQIVGGAPSTGTRHAVLLQPGGPDNDGDGIDASVEDAGPNAGDGNADGVLDSLQTNVASLPAATGVGYITIVSPSGTSLDAVRSQHLPPDPLPPTGLSFPAGLLSYAVRGVAVGATIQVDVILPTGSSPDSTVKFINGDYVTFPGGLITGNVVSLTLQDGDAFDADRATNGVIFDPIGFGESPTLTTTTSTSVSSTPNPSTFNSSVNFTATVAATTGSDVPTGTATFTIDGVAQAAVPLTSGSATITVADLALGSHEVTAAYTPADGAFAASDSLSAPVTQVVNAGPLASLTLSPASAIVATNTAQLYTVRGFDAFGNDLGDKTSSASLTVSPNGTCTANSCQATIAGLKVVTAGLGGVTTTASLDVRPRQTISFPAIAAKTMLQSPVAATATATSGLPVNFTSTTPSVCAAGGVNGTSITLNGPGTCTLQANQAGGTTWAPAATVSRSFTVSQVAQTITFAALTAKTITQSPVTAAGTASSGLTVMFTTSTPTVCSATGTNGTSIVLHDAGTCTVQANQPGDTIYRAATPVVRSFTVSKVANTITFPAIGGKTLAQSPVVVSATASSGLLVTFTTTTPAVCTAGGVNGSTIELLAAGTCAVRADQPGDAIYRAATSVNRTFTVSTVVQTITFPAIGTKTLAQSPVVVAATASSGLPVTFTTTTPAVCTAGGVDGSAIQLLATGTCTVRAQQPGSAYWRAATAVNRNFTVTLPPPSVQTFTASATLLGAAGGTIELTAQVSDAATCRYSVSPAVTGLPLTVACAGGSTATSVTLPPNTTAVGRNYTFSFSALRSGATTATATPVVVQVAPAG